MPDKKDRTSQLDIVVKRLTVKEQPPRPDPNRLPIAAPRPRMPTMRDYVPPPAALEEEVVRDPDDDRIDPEHDDGLDGLGMAWPEEVPTRDIRGRHRAEREAEEERKQVHVHVHQQQHSVPKGTTGSVFPVDKMKVFLQQGWVKALIALVIAISSGAGGSVVATKADPNAPARAAELEGQIEVLRIEIRALRRELKTAKTATALQAGESKQTNVAVYNLGRYFYAVLPELGVKVHLAAGKEEPKEPFEFLPAPLQREALGPNDPKPIQPREAFPLPDKP